MCLFDRIRERYQNMSLPIIGNSTDDVKSPRRTPPPTVIRRDRSCKRPHWREEYSSFISLERNMVSTPISVGDDSAGRQRLTGEKGFVSNTEDEPIAARLRSRKKLSQRPTNN
uniref:Uncharacterized protein n=2 Tax=Trichobilharzia regenti TaxID=157069 RepID=A0AA85K3U4_TRIRE|nr:unnamed protein product [Trichobilharzia regenti]